MKCQDATALHKGPQVTDDACWIGQVHQHEASDDKVDGLRQCELKNSHERRTNVLAFFRLSR